MKKQCGRREVFKNLRVAQKIDRGHPIQIVFQIDPFIKLNIIKTKINKTLNQTSKRKTKNMRQKKLNERYSALNQSIQ